MSVTLLSAACLYGIGKSQQSNITQAVSERSELTALQSLLYSVKGVETPSQKNSELAAIAEAEMEKFNLIWFYLANVNRTMELHKQQYATSREFLAACSGFDDFIASLHQMLYAAHALDVHNLNAIYPELGSRFQNTYIRGANLMLHACIDGSEKKYIESHMASNAWFSWYESNSKGILASLKSLL